ncbi:MAG: EamA family transporter [Bacteroidia bacterium]|nr:EamA family transporter [Bacteroidia bacterium]
MIWGTTFLAIRIGVHEFPPFLFAAIRQIGAGLFLTAIVFITQKPKLPNFRYFAQMAVMGFLMITLSNGLVSWAEVFVDSGIAAIICSLMPVLVILINLSVNRSELPNTMIVIGAIIGLAGIVLIFSEHLQSFADPNYTIGILLIFIAIVSWAAGSILVRKSNQNSNLFLNAGMQMLLGGIFCLPLSFMFDDLTLIHWTLPTIYSLVYLSIFGSAIAYVMYYYAISKLPMTLVSLYSYINPLVAVTLGSLILNEKFNLKIGFAFVVTLVGIYLVNRGYLITSTKSDLDKTTV